MADTGERDIADIFARELRSWVLGRGKNVRSWDELPPATRDRYVRAGNPDDSGRVAHAATTPVAGLLWRAHPHHTSL